MRTPATLLSLILPPRISQNHRKQRMLQIGPQMLRSGILHAPWRLSLNSPPITKVPQPRTWSLQVRREVAAVKIQSTWRMHTQRKVYRTRRQTRAAIVIQSYVRMLRQRTRFRHTPNLLLASTPPLPPLPT